MPELKAIEGRDTWPAADIDWEKYAFLDKLKEETRQAELTKAKADAENGIISHKSKTIQKPTMAWSKQIEAKEKRELNKEKKARKRAYLKEEAKKLAEPSLSVKDDAGLSDEDDAEDLAQEERAAKKVKRGRMPQADFDMNFVDL